MNKAFSTGRARWAKSKKATSEAPVNANTANDESSDHGSDDTFEGHGVEGGGGLDGLPPRAGRLPPPRASLATLSLQPALKPAMEPAVQPLKIRLK